MTLNFTHVVGQCFGKDDNRIIVSTSTKADGISFRRQTTTKCVVEERLQKILHLQQHHEAELTKEINEYLAYRESK